MKSSQLLSNPKVLLASVGLSAGSIISFVLFILFNSVHVNAAEQTEDIINDTDIVTNITDVGHGSLLFKQDSHYSKAAQLNIDVVMSITGMINRVIVTQSFSNTTDDWQEGIYVFPLPENAAVDQMRLKIGERLIEGQIKEKQAAKKIYKQAKRQGKRAALTEQERPNIFTTSVANIAPHETIKVEIEYQQIVNYDNGVFSLRFPMVVGPRYIPGKQRIEGFSGAGWAVNTDEVPHAARITPQVLRPGNNRNNTVSIKIDLDAGLALEKIDSPYHAIDINKQSDQYQIVLKQETTLANRDFELIWKPKPSVAPKAALFTEKKNGETYAMIMMVPPEMQEVQSLNREIIYVIDTSGSMGGQSIIQARAALELALTRLKPGDKFNVIQFNSITSKLFQYSQEVNQQALDQAIRYVRSLQATGGTEMASALHAALNNQQNNNYLRQVIFLTDGSIGNEQTLFEIIQNKLGNSRLFTVGIGSAPNSHFMQRAANFGRGTHTYIGKLDEVQTRMQVLFEKIENPVLKDIAIDWMETDMEIWPQKITDLYKGEPLVITAKTRNEPGEVKITGQVSGKTWASSLILKGGQNRKGISTLWARNKIAALMEQKRDAEFESIKQTIIETALEHHLVSKFTSLVAVDVTPVRPIEKKLDSHAIQTHLPAGWDHNKVFGQQFPATATDARLNFIIGLFLMLLSSLIYLTRYRNSYV
ncbi:MAG: marine proteobacterial sortase target protein [Proteobacteria bacterium]|nr:marine proteobacterial sortase target protein [Pseudomonadota bacterium]NOG61136.1 marine proteobacterial sortase target protein [Pseudomonadota bacterium]